MTMLFPVLVFLAVSLAIVGVAVWLSPTRTEQRLQAVAMPAGKSAWTEKAVKIVGPFAQLSSPTMGCAGYGERMRKRAAAGCGWPRGTPAGSRGGSGTPIA